MVSVAGEDTINIGLTAKDNSNKQTIGKCNNSFGYFKGDLYLAKRKVFFVTYRLLLVINCKG